MARVRQCNGAQGARWRAVGTPFDSVSRRYPEPYSGHQLKSYGDCGVEGHGVQTQRDRAMKHIKKFWKQFWCTHGVTFPIPSKGCEICAWCQKILPIEPKL